MLKEPIAGQCESAGLKGCPDLADGVVMYIDGDEKKAQEKLVTAAAANSPEDLSSFICAIKAIEMVPGAGDYMGPVLKVVEILEQAKQGAEAGEPGQGDAVGGAGGRGQGASKQAAAVERCPRLPDTGNVLTAATDPARLRVGVATQAPGADRMICPAGIRCSVVRAGPFVVTDLQTPAHCPVTVFAADPLAEQPRPSWAVSGPLRIHGARLLVDGGKVFAVGTPEGEPPCELLWAGFEPYSSRQAVESPRRGPSRDRATSPSLHTSD